MKHEVFLEKILKFGYFRCATYKSSNIGKGWRKYCQENKHECKFILHLPGRIKTFRYSRLEFGDRVLHPRLL